MSQCCLFARRTRVKTRELIVWRKLSFSILLSWENRDICKAAIQVRQLITKKLPLGLRLCLTLKLKRSISSTVLIEGVILEQLCYSMPYYCMTIAIYVMINDNILTVVDFCFKDALLQKWKGGCSPTLLCIGYTESLHHKRHPRFLLWRLIETTTVVRSVLSSLDYLALEGMIAALVPPPKL